MKTGLTFTEAESAVLFPHPVQTGLAEAKFTEARNRQDKQECHLATDKESLLKKKANKYNSN